MPTQLKELAIYDAFDNGKYLMTGTASEVRDKIGMPQSCGLSNYFRAKYLGRYWFRKVGTVKKKVEVTYKNPAHVYKTSDETLDYLYRHLRDSGITVLTKDPTAYIPLLKEKGIEVKVRRAYNLTGRRRKSWYHVLEVI